jgi:hypothetical protein
MTLLRFRIHIRFGELEAADADFSDLPRKIRLMRDNKSERIIHNPFYSEWNLDAVEVK